MKITSKQRYLCASLSLCAAFLGATSLAHADFALKPNDRVVFYGDSITDQRLYTTFVETYVVTRFPKLPLYFVHSGWGGDRVTGGGGGPIDLRLQRDVLAYHPTVMTIMLGMNDGGYHAFDQGTYDTYANGYKHILDSVKQGAPGVRFTLIQPSPYDDVTRAPGFPGGYNAVLQRYAGFVKDTAQKNNMGVADFNTPVVAMLQKANATDPTLAQKILPDRVHPGPGGHLVMAEALLKSWDAPSLVAGVEIDAATRRATHTDNTQVTDVKGRDSLSWTQTDASLPFPIDTSDPAVALAVKSSDLVSALDNEPLKITNLKAPNYTLKIDGDEVGDFTREQLGQGINLATLTTPMMDQAMEVHRLTLKHNDLHFNRWRNIQVPYESHSATIKNALVPFLTALDGEEADVVAQQRAAAQPKPHVFELVVAVPQPAGANLALNKPFVSDHPNTFGWGGPGLTDGSFEGTNVHTFASDDTKDFPKNATIDLGAATRLGYVRVSMPAFGSTKTVVVSLSTDGKTFSEVGRYAFPLATERKHLFAFPAASARYIRLTYPDHYDDERNYPATFVFTSEVEAYAPNN